MNDNDSWNSAKEEVPPPLYQLHLHTEEESEEPQAPAEEIASSYSLLQSLKQDLLPILFLMAGSLFMLFGIVLLLFAQDGFLTLQWKGSYWIYFVLFSLPILYFGWKYWRELDEA